jgi:hypothetical protein
MKELKTAGHDLWIWEPGEVWGYDYVTARQGAGLRVTCHVDDDESAASAVAVEFTSLKR